VNPLQVRARRLDPEDGRGRAARSGWFDIACCPPNIMRSLASLQHYFATTTETGAQLWQFAPSHLSIEVPGGHLELSVETDYPHHGRVSVHVGAAPPAPFEIAVRVPAWAEGATGRVQSPEPSGGTTYLRPERLQPGSLWRTTRSWREGDVIVMDMPMGPRAVHPHPRIDAVRGCIAFERGPLVYCLEEIDAGGADRLEAFRVPAGISLEAMESSIDGEPLVSLEGRAQLVAADDENSFPYRDKAWPRHATAGTDIRLVPYFIWGNRRPGEAMRVWLPEA
jgi:DUF1680 family protein